MRILPSATILCAFAAAVAVAQQVPRPSTNLEIELPQGKKLALHSLRGKSVVLTFISTT
jgi:hypothetical protein